MNGGHARLLESRRLGWLSSLIEGLIGCCPYYLSLISGHVQIGLLWNVSH